jgi:hypothetical protein
MKYCLFIPAYVQPWFFDAKVVTKSFCIMPHLSCESCDAMPKSKKLFKAILSPILGGGEQHTREGCIICVTLAHLYCRYTWWTFVFLILMLHTHSHIAMFFWLEHMELLSVSPWTLCSFINVSSWTLARWRTISVRKRSYFSFSKIIFMPFATIKYRNVSVSCVMYVCPYITISKQLIRVKRNLMLENFTKLYRSIQISFKIRH